MCREAKLHNHFRMSNRVGWEFATATKCIEEYSANSPEPTKLEGANESRPWQQVATVKLPLVIACLLNRRFDRKESFDDTTLTLHLKRDCLL